MEGGAVLAVLLQRRDARHVFLAWNRKADVHHARAVHRLTVAFRLNACSVPAAASSSHGDAAYNHTCGQALGRVHLSPTRDTCCACIALRPALPCTQKKN